MRTAVFISIIIFIYGSNVLAQPIRDLGNRGPTCALDRDSIKKQHNKKIVKEGSFDETVNISKIRFGYSLSSQSSYQSDSNFSFPFENKGRKIQRKVIFVFAANDLKSVEKGKSITADYGICVKYRSLDDIAGFRQQTGVNFPIQPGNSEIVKFFKISQVPALVTIDQGEITVETDF